ncbi:hypothetical protein CHELA40_15148 [Chelatococcus asaccharovorans]|nr:hypothetical protein CHELA17_60472 [Chelatococcus asaccharovorans]CAH1681647.1 hypothetical protein CHELA40_15148 [Chelatococcus asaccharovorans]
MLHVPAAVRSANSHVAEERGRYGVFARAISPLGDLVIISRRHPAIFGGHPKSPGPIGPWVIAHSLNGRISWAPVAGGAFVPRALRPLLPSCQYHRQIHRQYRG